MDVMQLRRGLIVKDEPFFPSGYRKIDYIGARGVQYIDTGYSNINDATNDFILTYKVTGFRKSFGFYGADIASDYNQRICMLWSNASGKLQVSCGKTTSGSSGYNGVYDLNAIYTTRVFCDNINNRYAINGNGDYTYSGFSNNRNPIMFGYAQVNQIGDVDYYNFKIFGDSVLKRNFIPCIRISDNVAGAYDTVTKTFFTNSGTGEFIVPS